jgi:hypothetical protein
MSNVSFSLKNKKLVVLLWKYFKTENVLVIFFSFAITLHILANHVFYPEGQFKHSSHWVYCICNYLDITKRKGKVFFVWLVGFETESCCVAKLASNKSSCLSLPSFRITGMNHNSQKGINFYKKDFLKNENRLI